MITTVSAPADTPGAWDTHSLGRALAKVALFGLTGVIVAIIGYKLFDAATPGDMHKEIFDNRNSAAAMVAGAVIVGVCIIVASSIAH